MADKEMSREDLEAILGAHLVSSIGFLGGELSDQREEALQRYYGEPYGDEIEDRSQVVTRETMETVDWVLPSLMRIFFSSDRLGRLEPVGPEDETEAETRTDYVNLVMLKDNPAFMVYHDWFKDALLQKVGVIKTWWDDQPVARRERYSGLSLQDIDKMLKGTPGEDIEIVTQEKVEADEDAVRAETEALAEALAMPPEQVAMLGVVETDRYNVVLKRTTTRGRLRFAGVPPEEFLISARARDLGSALLKAHRSTKTVSEAIEMGFNAEQAKKLAGKEEEGPRSIEDNKRFDIDEDQTGRGAPSQDESTRELSLVEAYLRVDFDGDGIAELRRIFASGDETCEILEWADGGLANEEVDDHAFDSVCAVPVPHKFVGLSLHDLVKDLEKIHTTVVRQLLDNMYGINNNRSAISNKVDIEDMLVKRPDGIVRVDTDMADVGGHISSLQIQPIVGAVQPILEILQQMVEARTGVSRLKQGLDPEALNKTAKGMAMLMGAANERIELIARIFAETGVKSHVKRCAKLIQMHQDTARMVKLKNEWVEMDPRHWDADMDVTTDVGLGYDSREQEAMLLQSLVMAVQEKIVSAQGGLNGPIVDWETVHNAATKAADVAGIRNAERYFKDPNSEQGKAALQQMQSRPDPKMAEAEGKLKMQQAKDAADDDRKRQQMFLDFQLKQMELGMEFNLERSKAMFNASLDIADRNRRAAADRATISANGVVQ
jgi:hypothetical protein